MKQNHSIGPGIKKRSPIPLRSRRQEGSPSFDPQTLGQIEAHFAAIMQLLGLDLKGDSIKDTPRRVAKMYLNEMFWGLRPESKPRLSTFRNDYKYGQMLVEKSIAFHSTCEHHFLPIIGQAHVAYISSGTIIGLSKINRLVGYCAARPQLQERMTVEILNEMRSALKSEDVAVLIEAVHLCVTARGIRDRTSSTVTMEYSGAFLSQDRQREFLEYVRLPSQA